MMPEVSLMAVLVIVFIADFFTAPRVADVQAGADFKAPRAWFGPLVCVLMLAHTLLNLAPVESAVTFGGMYYTTPSIGIIKSKITCLKSLIDNFIRIKCLSIYRLCFILSEICIRLN